LKRMLFMIIAGPLAAIALFGAPNTSGAGTTQLTGQLSRQGTKYVLTDEMSHDTFEMQGGALKKYLGHRVHVSGRAMASNAAGSTQVFQVVSIGNVRVAGATTGTTAAGVATGASVSTAVVVAASAAAVGGTLGGLYASGALGSNSAPISRP